MAGPNQKIGEMLVEDQLITPEQLLQAREIQKNQGRGLGSILIETGALGEKELSAFLEKHLGLPIRHWDEKLRPRLRSDLVDLLGEDYCRNHLVLPAFYTSESSLALLMANPADLATVEEVRFLTETELEIYFIPEFRLLPLFPGAAGDPGSGAGAGDDQLAGDTIQQVNKILEDAIRMGASDIHVEAGAKDISLRFRVDGLLRPGRQKIDSGEMPALIARVKILAGLDISERRLPQDGRIRFKQGDKEIDLRVSIIPGIHGESAVLRLLDKSGLDVSLEGLGFDNREIRRIRGQLKRSHGLVLMTGPTGSGKTTTLYAMLQEVNKPEVKILTAEDPVEYQLPGVMQVPVHPEIGLDFAQTLRSFLRHDPDIIMVGEIRDAETSAIAVRAALTGHLVLSTLHTNDAPSAVTRLIDMGVRPYLVTGTLNLVMAQRLVRRLCSHCRRKTKVSQATITGWGLGRQIKENEIFYEPAGCDLCFHSGFRGRVAILEVLEINEKLRRAIIEGAGSYEIHRLARRQGMKTLLETGLARAKKGLTTVDEVLRVSMSDG